MCAAGTPKGVLLSHGNVVSASKPSDPASVAASDNSTQSDQYGPYFTNTLLPKIATWLSYPLPISSNSSSRTHSSSPVCLLDTDELRLLPMRVLGSAKEISPSSSQSVHSPYCLVPSDHLTEYHGRSSSSLGTDQEGYPIQSRRFGRSQEVDLQLCRQGEADRCQLLDPRSCWINRCCRLQRRSSANWRKVEDHVQRWWSC